MTHVNLLKKLLLGSRFYECHAMSSFIFAKKIAIQVYFLFYTFIFYCLNRLQKRQPRCHHRRRLEGHPLLMRHITPGCFTARIRYGFLCYASIEFRHPKPSDLVLRARKINDQDD